MEFQKIIRAIASNKKFNIAQQINAIKQRVNPAEYKSALQTNPLYHKHLNNNNYIWDIENIKIREPYQFTEDLKREFKWLTINVEQHLENINAFVLLKNKFETTILLGDFDLAEQIIKDIETVCGISLWTIEAKMLLVDLSQGSNENWNILTRYLKEVKNSFYEFNINSSSKRVESKLSYESFLNQFQNDIDNIDANGFIKDYFVFKNFQTASYEYEFKNLEGVLYVSNIFSVIDQYLMLIDVIVYNINHYPELNYIFSSFVNKSKDIVTNDLILVNIHNLISKKAYQPLPNNSEILDCLDSYYSGEFEISFNKAKALLSKHPSDYNLFQIYCKSLIHEEKGFEPTNLSKTLDDILQNTYMLLSFNKAHELFFQNLLKYGLVFINTGLGKQIFELLSEVNGESKPYLYSSICTSYTTPNSLLYSDGGYNVIEKFKSLETHKSFQVIKYMEGLDGDGISTSKSQAQSLIIDAKHLFRIKNYEKAIEILSKPSIALDKYNQQFATSLLFYSYLKSNKLDDALRVFGWVLFDEAIVYPGIDYVILYERIKSATEKSSFVGNIDYPILYSLIVKEYDLYEVYDDFMETVDTNFVREINIEQFTMDFGLSKTVYFLHKVITIDTIKYCTDYNSISDVEEDRIFILDKLIEIDQINKNKYQKEIDEIYRANAVRKVLKEVDEGRLYIDINSLKELQIKKFKDDFNRFKDIEHSSSDKDLIGFNPSNKNWESALTRNIDFTNGYNSADYLAFKNIYLESRENFLYSKEYGLDSCLSTRIRHGALKNHIRSVFEKLNLVTSKAKDLYLENPIWASELVNHPEANSIIQDELKSFSRSIDDYNLRIVDKFIQIQTEKNTDQKEGLFEYYTNDETLHSFYVTYKSLFSSVESAIDMLLSSLVNHTLINIQNNIFNTFRGTISAFYQQLIESTIQKFRQLDLPPDCNLILNLNKSSTDIQKELEYLSEWFYLNTTSSSSILSIETIINASLNLTNRINPLFGLSPNIVIDKEFAGYSSMIFVFNILLKNVIEHSKLDPDKLNLEIAVGVDDDNHSAYVRVTNDLNPNIDYTQNINKLEQIKLEWNNHENIERSNKEGESGYDKIKRILLYEAIAKSEFFDYLFFENKISITLFFPYNKPLQENENIDNRG
jgi:hypothetical protein